MKQNSDVPEKGKVKKLPSELRKEVNKYRQKSELWKKRNAEKRIQLQISMSKVTDLEESRNKWKDDARIYKDELENLRRELEKSKQDSIVKQQEIEVLKKKLR